jgi:DNA-binding transcriptional LysR family regulator
MDLRHLRYFVAVAEELHFRRAAERLNISQPPLSQQIKELEIEIGAQLFRRSRRQVRLTAAGKVLLDRARIVLRDASELAELARRAQRGEAGEISVGFIHTAGYGLVPAVIRQFRDANPAVEISLEQQGSLAQTRELGRGRIDVGFTWSAAVDDGQASECLLRERFVVALPRSHPKSRQRQLSLAAFADESFVSFPSQRAPFLHGAVFRICAAAGFVPRIGHETDSVHTVLGLVAAGCGIGIVPASAVEISTRDVSFCVPEEQEPQAEISLQWRSDDASPVVARFIAAARLAALRYQRSRQVRIARQPRRLV